MDASVTTPIEPPAIESSRLQTSGFSVYLVCFGVAIFLYVLSPGPVVKCLGPPGKNPVVDAVLITVYAPLVFCSDRFRPVERFYGWYLQEVWHAQ
jgi:hypothetical protein